MNVLLNLLWFLFGGFLVFFAYLLGGIILYSDQPVKVGDFCKFGSQRGTVEAVGLRSVKIRTLDRTVVAVVSDHGEFARAGA